MIGKAKKINRNMRTTTRKNLITFIMVITMYVVVQILISAGLTSRLFEGILVPICMYVILAVSLNLVVGILGELSLGHAGFMCIGAYASAIFSVIAQDSIPNVGIRFTLAIITGGIFAAIFGAIIGIPVLRLEGDYLAIVTLAFGEIIKNLMNSLYLGTDKNGLHISFDNATKLNLDSETGKLIADGTQGVYGTPQDATFTIGFILILITLFVIMNFIDSRTGRAIKAIRDNRIAAESIGINITKYKLLAFVVSAFFAGIAGVLFSHNYATLTATAANFGYNKSIMILVLVVLGGIGNIRGSVIAAIILTALPEMLRGLQDYRMLIYAIILIAVMLLNNNEKFKEFLKKISPRNLFSKKKTSAIKEDA